MNTNYKIKMFCIIVCMPVSAAEKGKIIPETVPIENIKRNTLTHTHTHYDNGNVYHTNNVCFKLIFTHKKSTK